MTSYQDGAGAGKSLKFVDGLKNPFGGMLGRQDNDVSDESNNAQRRLSEQFDTRLRIQGTGSSGAIQSDHYQYHHGSRSNVATSPMTATAAQSSTTTSKLVSGYNTSNGNSDNGLHHIQKAEDDDLDEDDDDDEWGDILENGLVDADDDAVLEAFRQRRLEEMKQSYLKVAESKSLGHGEVRTISQDEFLPECTTTKSKFVVVHFFHNEFEKCKVMDSHLKKIASTHLQCKFVRIDAEKAPFFVVKLRIRTLPTLIVFENGNEKTRMIGFEDLITPSESSTSRSIVPDNFPTSRLGIWLEKSGALEYEGSDGDEIDSELNDNQKTRGPHRSARSGIIQNCSSDNDWGDDCSGRGCTRCMDG